ncbi:MAG: hypothetical protein KAU28_04275 [Phycisphaerae bacterium]|nr:hypothetical protein [Phycisphaerae bacterium]
MTGDGGLTSGSISGMVKMEDQLAATLFEASDEIAHTECLDNEQRAEVYTILQALKSDTNSHRALIELLARKVTGESPDA